MNEPVLWGWGVRDMLLLAGAIAAVYLVVVLLRLLQLRRKAPAGKAPAVSLREPRVAVEPLGEFAPPLRRQEAAPSGDVAYAPLSQMPSFDAALGHVALEHKVQSLGIEVQALRSEVTRLQNEVKKLDAARNVSPLYGEAVSLAQQGMDAATVAVRCGISIAEAELVTSLTAQSRAPAGGEHFHDEELS